MNRWRRFRLLAVVAALIVAVGLVGGGYVLAARTSENQQTTVALCALKHNLEHRGQQANDFLRENPSGAGGISRGVIVKSIRDTRQTIHALRGLHC